MNIIEIFTSMDKKYMVLSTVIILLYVIVIRFGTEKFNARHLSEELEQEYRDMSKYSWKMRTYALVAFFGTIITFMASDRINWFNSIVLVVISIFEFADNKNLYNEAKELYKKNLKNEQK